MIPDQYYAESYCILRFHFKKHMIFVFPLGMPGEKAHAKYARCAQVTMIKQVDAGVVDICAWNHLYFYLSNNFVFIVLFALLAFIC